MRLAITTAAAILVASNAWSDAAWSMQRLVQNYGGESFANCFLHFNVDDAYPRTRALTLHVSSGTAEYRYARGDENPWKPLMVFYGNVLKSQKRIAENPYVDQQTCTVQLDGDGRTISFECDEEAFEYRIRYRINGGPLQDAWVEGGARVVFGANGIATQATTTNVRWIDPPEELFESNEETKALLVRFPGTWVQDFSSQDRRTLALAFVHRANVMYTFEYGKEAMRVLNHCVQEQRDAGRMSIPDSETGKALREEMANMLLGAR